MSNEEKKFRDFVVNIGPERSFVKEERMTGQLLMDVFDFYPYLFRSVYIAQFFQNEYGLEKKYVLPFYGNRGRLIAKYLFPFGRLSRIYRAFGFKKGFYYGDLAWSEYSHLRSEANFIFENLSTKQDVVSIEIEGIRVGDLVYDTYLRDNKCETVNIKDPLLNEIIIESLIIYYSSKKYLDRSNVKKIVLSHAVYIQYGILARLAVNRNIDVYLFSKWNTQVVHKLTRDHYLQTNNHLMYRKKFLTVLDKEEKLKKAREILKQRLSGVIDSGTSYMKESAYCNVKNQLDRVLVETGRPKLVIMLHCFFDSPHIYKDMIFADFSDWLDYTLSVAISTKFDIYVKPHPNGFPGNDKIVESFKLKYPNVNFIDKKVSNKQLISENIGAVVTVYGTLGHEFPYLGVPVITAGDNPHSAYDFCNHAKTKSEYKFLIENIDKLSRDISKKDIEEFFYMHYLCPIDGRLVGNNDLFSVGCDSLVDNREKGSRLLVELINEAENGAFDTVYDDFKLAIASADRNN